MACICMGPYGTLMCHAGAYAERSSLSAGADIGSGMLQQSVHMYTRSLLGGGVLMVHSMSPAPVWATCLGL